MTPHRRLLLLAPSGVALVTGAVVGLVAVSGWHGSSAPSDAFHATLNPHYASQSRSNAAARKAQIHWTNAEDEDAALETCTALGLRRLAARFGVPATPSQVARAFASQWDPAYRAGAYRGCFQALRGAGG